MNLRIRSTRGIFTAATVLVAMSALVVIAWLGGGSVRASGSTQLSGSGLAFQPELALQASKVRMIGASPSAGEVWAEGDLGAVGMLTDGLSSPLKGSSTMPVLLRRSEGQGWQVVPVVDSSGRQLGFSDSPPVDYQAITGDGSIALLGVDEAGNEALITRDPLGSFATAPAPPTTGPAALNEGEQLYSTTAPLAAALDEPVIAGQPVHTGALVVPMPPPSDPGVAAAVMHYDGSQWSREPICESYSSGSSCEAQMTFKSLDALAIAAASPQSTWLLASVEVAGSSHLALFQRHATGSGGFVWVEPPGWSFDIGLPAGVSSASLSAGSMLTITSQGVWIDASLRIASAQRGSIARLFSAANPNHVIGTWCYPLPASQSLFPTAQSLCGVGARSLGGSLVGDYSSFAWPGSNESDPGTRIVTGLEDGALLALHGAGDFVYTIGGGGGGRSAFLSAQQGWIGEAGTIGGNEAQIVHVTGVPEASQLQSWPTPFRRPLLALAQQPGTAPGDSSAEALAVGDQGEIARYIPGQGWTAEFLYNGSGEVQRPRLRGVAWPEANRAYAVGDNGAMWLWRADTGLWEPDPAKPLGFSGHLNGIAFSPSNPAVGYAVGKQGVLLSYDKTWEQLPAPEREQLEEELKVDEQKLNFTSVAFAGTEALATYRLVNATETGETGGLIVNDGSGWHVDTSSRSLLDKLPPTNTVLSRVAGLSDGGAVAAGPGLVIERDSSAGAWRLASEPLPEAQNVTAVAAVREGAGVRALVSIDLGELGDPNENGGAANRWLKSDSPQGGGLGQPTPLDEPDPLPVSGYLLRETATGWQDVEHQAYHNPLNSQTNLDEPAWPDAVLALDVAADGSQGWAVGGQTGALVATSAVQGAQLAGQTAATLRLGAGPPPPLGTEAAISIPVGQATFALGGHAQCAGPCAGFANEGLGPDVWLSAAVERADRIAGLRGFLYTGAHVAQVTGGQPAPSGDAFEREMLQYGRDLSFAGALPVYPAASPSDAPTASLAAFETTVLGGRYGSTVPGAGAPPAGTAAYAAESTGSGGSVRVIVLDYSAAKLAPGELGWLAEELLAARHAGVPAIVMGSADIVHAEAANFAQDAAAVKQVLLQDGASAYLFDSPGENISEQIGSGTQSIPVFGSGTLGYVLPPTNFNEYLGASGFLLVSVDGAQRVASTNVAPVTATLTPSISQLALYASDGTLLRRSSVALFQGLARRPPAGFELAGGLTTAGEPAPEPYVPIPQTCQGPHCAGFIAPSYAFTSSKPDIGNFVEQDLSNSNPRAALEGPGDKPIPDSHSGLFCAFNPGTTTVSVETGGLVYHEQVTVQGGSVEQPCGTVPLINPPPAKEKTELQPTGPGSGGNPSSSSSPVTLVPPPPPPTLANAPAPRSAKSHPAAPFFVLPPPAVPLAAALLPLSPVLARPIPPSGTAPVSVFSPAVAPEEEKEHEEATESVHNMAAYYPSEKRLPPGALIALIALAAGVGVGAAGVGRGLRRRQVPAHVRVGRGRPGGSG